MIYGGWLVAYHDAPRPRLQLSDQAAALMHLVEAQRQIVEAQRVLIAQQQEQIATLVAQFDQACERAEGDWASLLAQMKQQRDQAGQDRQRADQDRADLITALERARADEARVLEALCSTLGKVPRWLRALLGLEV